MAKYKKRKDGRYFTSVTIGRTEDGKRKLKFFYGATIRELDAKLAEFKSLQNKGIVISDNNMTLASWSEKWLDAYKQGVAYNTHRMYKSCVSKHIITCDIANYPLSKIKTVDLQMVINEKQEAGLTRTVEIIILTLRQIFNQAIENEMLYKNPAKALKKPTRTAPQKRALTDMEKRVIKEAPLTDRERAFVYLGMYAGLRRGEILALMRGDINMNQKTIAVNKTIIFKGNIGEIKHTPKTAAGVREIPFPNILYNHLAIYLKLLDGLYLFPARNSNLCTLSTMIRMWESIIKKLNITFSGSDAISPVTGLTPHILRHNYATSLYYAGVDIKTAQKLLGHTDIAMTLQVYTHLEQDNEDIKSKLNNAFGE
jgi:integrase